MAKSPVFKIPKKLAECADLFYELRAKRLEMQKAVDEIAERCKLLQEHLINELPKSNASGISGAVANAKVEVSDIYSVRDWTAFEKYALKQANPFIFFQRRLNNAALDEVLTSNKKLKTIPGVEKFQYAKLSCTKI